MTIPVSARVIEWKTLQGRPAVAWRADPGGLWTRGNTPPYSTKDLLAAIDGAPIAVLASFPEPTLEELVGDAEAFRCKLIGGTRRIAYKRWGPVFNSWVLAEVGEYSSLEKMQAAAAIDLSSVQPLYPRQP